MACIAMAMAGVTAPECWDDSMGNLVDRGAFLKVYGGSNYLSAARCNIAYGSEAACLKASFCPENHKPIFVQMSWRDVRDSRDMIIAPNSYSHILDCAEPEKDTP